MKGNFLILSFLILVCCNGKSQNKKDMIPLEEIQNMYDNMKANGVKTDSEFLYSYFFVSENKSKLENLKPELSNEKFSTITIEKHDDGNFWLTASRIENHNAKSLFDLDKTFYKLADKYEIEYDGFDLGNPDGKSGIERDTYVVPEEFKLGNLENNNLPELIILNSAFEHFPHKSEFKYLLNFNISYKTLDKSKLPSEKDLEKLDKLEFSIEDSLNNKGIKNYYVFRTTNNGERNFYIAVPQLENAKKALNKIVSKNKMNLTVIEDSDWKIYYETLKKLPKESQ